MATTVASQSAVNTGQVHGRRELRFQSVDEILGEAERLLAHGYTKRGNWSLGQMCGHLTEGMRFRLEPAKFKVPAPVRLIATMFFKRGALQKMKPGFKLPAKASFMVPNPADDAAGVAQLREFIGRWHREDGLYPHPFFGKLTRDEWDRLAMRHAEMHLSFLDPR